MKDRIITFLKTENKSAVNFADEIGVQPSSISHILSGRNKPSLDFVLKMLERYDYISNEWLLFGKGKMYKSNNDPSLFEDDRDLLNNNEIKEKDPITQSGFMNDMEDIDRIDLKPSRKGDESVSVSSETDSNVNKIVWFYKDNSFSIFSPK